MSYDRLSPEYDARLLICSIVKQGKYIAKYVPPTLELGPNLADYHSIIDNKEDAVKINKLIPQERKDFLIDRIPYWDKYGRLESKGLIHSEDKE
jgi:hypothetical protein